MTAFEQCKAQLRHQPKHWLVTGAAGFIGSNLVEALLRLDQRVTGLDNFATGYKRNLEEVRGCVPARQWERFRFINADINDVQACAQACTGVDVALHQAALGAVPRSIAHPLLAHAANSTGFLNVLLAARDAGVTRFVYATSSSVYGDLQAQTKVEDEIGSPMSPYAVTKRTNELYAAAFAHCYGTESIGLRYFNVFGRRQDPGASYAAVIPTWISAMLRGEPVYVNGDGETTRDFCYIDNAVQANLLAATTADAGAVNQVYNVGAGERTSLNQLFELTRSMLARRVAQAANCRPVYRDFRVGDVRHALADISKARQLLGFDPTHGLAEGLVEAMDWYVANAQSSAAS